LHKIEQACKRVSHCDKTPPKDHSKQTIQPSPMKTPRQINMSSLISMSSRHGPPSPVNNEEMQMMQGDIPALFDCYY
jgi:hypothetical protein